MESIEYNCNGKYDLWMWIDGKSKYMGEFATRELAEKAAEELNKKFGFVK